MLSNKKLNEFFLIISGCLILVANIALIFSVGLHASYHYKDFYVTPALRYFYVYIAVAFLIYFYSIYLRRKSKLSKSTLILIALYVSYPAYFLSAKYKVDIPRTVYFEDLRYDIPWEFQPSGDRSIFIIDDFGSSVPFVSISTSYPEFSLPIKFGTRKEKEGYDVTFTKTKKQRKWAYYLGECAETFLKLEKGKPAKTHQLRNAVLDNVDITGSSDKLQSTWIETENCKIQLFQQNNNQGKLRTYGLCRQNPKYLRCDYIIEEEAVIYRIGLYSNNPKSINTWSANKVFPVIERETKKLLNSFLEN